MRQFLSPLTLRWGGQLPSDEELEAAATSIVEAERYEVSARASHWHGALSLWALFDSECEGFEKHLVFTEGEAFSRDVHCNARFQLYKLHLRAKRLGIDPGLLKRAYRSSERHQHTKECD